MKEIKYVDVREIIKVIENLCKKQEINNRQKEIIILEIYHECCDPNKFKRPQ